MPRTAKADMAPSTEGLLGDGTVLDAPPKKAIKWNPCPMAVRMSWGHEAVQTIAR